jgi:hypothetical protein
MEARKYLSKLLLGIAVYRVPVAAGSTAEGDPEKWGSIQYNPISQNPSHKPQRMIGGRWTANICIVVPQRNQTGPPPTAPGKKQQPQTIASEPRYISTKLLDMSETFRPAK